MQLPPLPEMTHPKVQALQQKSDQELVTLFQRHPEVGQYFAAIFCRYGQVIYTLIGTSTRSPVQADYLFVKTWEFIYHELRALDLRAVQPRLSLQSWLINIAAMMINRAQIPDVEDIQFSLSETSPVFWCFFNQALNQMPGDLRLVLTLSQTFKWSHTRIAAYFHAEGEVVSASDVQELLCKAYLAVEEILPADICEIYLESEAKSYADLKS
ncbi:MAG: sigma-70 family RNA polymerase sigma factor [Oscillatoriales cyanobacterium SM2_2_1]|nr:sigma-70 family RNA polymerase sigma factor [Oscillatoriales cyanobacterium SM2_2_1]